MRMATKPHVDLPEDATLIAVGLRLPVEGVRSLFPEATRRSLSAGDIVRKIRFSSSVSSGLFIEKEYLTLSRGRQWLS